jgi:hypothetical protein
VLGSAVNALEPFHRRTGSREGPADQLAASSSGQGRRGGGQGPLARQGCIIRVCTSMCGYSVFGSLTRTMRHVKHHAERRAAS